MTFNSSGFNEVGFNSESEPAHVWDGITGVLSSPLDLADIFGSSALPSSIGELAIPFASPVGLGVDSLLPVPNSLLDDLPIASFINSFEADHGRQDIRTALPEHLHFLIPAGMGMSNMLSLLMQVGVSVQNLQSLANVVSGESVQNLQKLLQWIMEIDIFQGDQFIKNSLKGIATTVYSTTYDIYIDGVSVKHKIVGARISVSQASVHNSITLTSSSEALFNATAPSSALGSQRIEVHVGTRVLFFMLERRDGKEDGFTIWGRSLSAQIDDPVVEPISHVESSRRNASEVAEDIADTRVLDWDCDDWLLPDGFWFTGYRIEGIVKLASAIGAVARSQDDGSILVRKRYQVRPINIHTESPVVSLNRESILDLSFKDVIGSGIDRVNVYGYSSDSQGPTMEIDENSRRVKGETVTVRVYWQSDIDPDDVEASSTDGSIVYRGATVEQVTETVQFQDGIASTTKPIHSFLRNETRWIGRVHSGDVLWTRNANELILVGIDQSLETRYKIGEVRYLTKYWKYELTGHDVAELLMSLKTAFSTDIAVSVYTGSGDTPDNDIDAPLLSTDSAAVVRGEAHLDSVRYDRKIVSLSTPYQDDIVDGIVMDVEDDVLGISGNCFVVTADIVFDGPKVTNEVECEKCLV